MWPPVTRFSLCYLAGAVLGARVPAPPALLLGGALLLTLPWFRSPWRRTLLAAGVAGAALGTASARALRQSCGGRWEPGRGAALVVVHDAAPAGGRTRADVRHDPSGCRGTVRLRLGAVGVDAGATLIVVGTRHAGGWLHVRHARALGGHPPPIRFRVRDALRRRIASLYGPRAPFIDAVVLGRRDELDPVVREQFIGAGLAHLLAISGLHVGIVAGWVRWILSRIAGPSRAWSIATAATWIYVALLGFPAAATRAATFITVFAVARLRGRRPLTSAVVAVGALSVVTIDPSSLTSVGLWLSLAAVVGIAAAERWRRGGNPAAWVTWIAGSAGATLATAPLTALVFGSVAPVGLITNLVGVPLATLAIPAVFSSLLLGPTFAGAAGVLLAILERVASLSSQIPGGHLVHEPGWPFATPFALLALGAGWGAWHRVRWSFFKWRVVAVAATVWLGWLWVAWPSTRAGGELEVAVLSVGQGDAIVIRTPRGQWIVVDAGPRFGSADAGRRVVVPYLRRRGANRVAVAVASHGDADHAGGLPAVVRATHPDLVIEPGQALGTPLYREFLSAVELEAGRWVAARAGDTVTVDSVQLAILHPSAAWMASEVRPNENSVVMHLSYGEFDMLLTGDVGAPAESALASNLPQMEVLKVGHHGSAGSTTGRLLRAVRPQVAVVSVGRNRFGHPTPEVMARLRSAGADVFRTDQQGTVTIRTDGSYFIVTGQDAPNFVERVACRSPTWLRLNDSSSSRNDCTRTRRASSRTYSTMSPSPPRSSPGTSAAPGS